MCFLGVTRFNKLSGEASDYIEFCTCALLSHWFGHIVLLGYNKMNFKAGMCVNIQPEQLRYCPEILLENSF